MVHFLYCSSGNTVGLDEYVGWFEVNEVEDLVHRYLEIRHDGTCLRYTEEHAADEFGVLPEGRWSEAASTIGDREYGHLARVSARLFEAAWESTKAVNVVA